MMVMPLAKTGTLRKVRQPGHGWFDYEVLDVFGDELGPYGIAVYTVLARHCWGGFRVTMGLRELAAHARMSKSEVSRTLAKMIDLGLVVETKGLTPKSKSSYDLMDVKLLVEEMKLLAKERVSVHPSVPVGDRLPEGSATRPQDTASALPFTNRPISSGDAPTVNESDQGATGDEQAPDSVPEGETICPPQGQMLAAGTEGVEKPEIGLRSELAGTSLGTDLSLKRPPIGTDLSPLRARVRQETRSNKQEPTPYPRPGGGAVKNPTHTPAPEEPAPGPNPGIDPQKLWAAFIIELREAMHDVPIGLHSAKRWKEISAEQGDDFQACFSAWWLLEVERGPGGVVFRTFAENEAVTEAGIAKYSKRLTRALRGIFRIGNDVPVSFEVLRPGEASVPQGNRPIAIAAVDAGPETDLSPRGTDQQNHGPNGEIPEGDLELWEEIRRLAEEHLAKMAKTNPAVRFEWFEQGIEPAQLEAVEYANGGGVNSERRWKVRSPAPEITRAVLGLIQPVVPRVARGVRIVVLGTEDASP